MEPQTSENCVFIVDDDEGVCKALDVLLDSVGIQTETFSSAQAFMDNYAGGNGCLLLDIRMPQISGFELFGWVRENYPELPVIFLTGHGDHDLARRALKNGAADFLGKNCNDQELIEVVQRALQSNLEAQQARQQRRAVQERLSTLTARESEVARLLCDGLPTKTIAWKLNMSNKTVDVHRSNLLRKMEARSPAELTKMVMLLGANMDTASETILDQVFAMPDSDD
ncbi:response regulator transcription factor [Thiohalorhabdus sp. Cl-TMA]|uniref:Response regulator transcription factor n=1 Tax=Thiohalorhabdus methylotrophus TaxID=3242694 RepID=A0ABV4TVP5_9GAMM